MPAVDPKELSSWAKGGGGAPEMPPEEMESEEMPEEGEMEAGGSDKYAPIMEFLEEDADLIETACNEMDAQALMDEAPLQEEERQKMVSALAFLNPQLVDGMKQVMMETSYDEAMDLGAHLAEEGYCEDGDVVGGFLFHAKEALPDVTEDHHAAAAQMTEQAMASAEGAPPPEGEAAPPME